MSRFLHDLGPKARQRWELVQAGLPIPPELLPDPRLVTGYLHGDAELRIHYVEGDMSVCGWRVTDPKRTTADPTKPTCQRCRRSLLSRGA